MLNTTQETYAQKWKKAWLSTDFQKKIWSGIIALVLIFSFFPWFFQTIEKRPGFLLNDWVLERIPSSDVSIPIFVCIWLSTFLILIRCIHEPEIFVRFLWGYIFLCLSRVITISLVPLEPPRGLIDLTDHLANAFYGPKFVTRDLFYSGHTASVFLIFLCLRKKYDKLLVLSATIIVGVLLLVQHVHYTVDVVAAPVLTYAMYLLGAKVSAEGFLHTKNSQKASPN